MASLKGIVKPKNKFLATLVTGKKIPCAFCQREIDDELTYGKLYAIGDIQVHYFCVLLSCCLVQKGRDTEGLFGFLYSDIIAEVERSKKHKCSYCGNGGAALGCCVSQCRKQFHLPCGREKNAVSLFYGNYKSYCQQHAPKQRIPNHIMEVARLRMRTARNALRAPKNLSTIKELCGTNDVQASTDGQSQETESLCLICYEAVDGFPTVTTFWPPCCARDAWFHRSCLQRMALSAGMHYLKCPLCNDKEQFYDAVVSQGYYVPDRDAAWELEQNAFAEIYERAVQCGADTCKCPSGRGHDADTGEWDIKLCILCGTTGCHVGCLPEQTTDKRSERKSTSEDTKCDGDSSSGNSSMPSDEASMSKDTECETNINVIRYVCTVCKSCAPSNLEELATKVEAVMFAEQSVAGRAARRPIMPARMSLRRTKGRVCKMPSTSQMNTNSTTEQDPMRTEQTTEQARLELNLRVPRRQTSPKALRSIENNFISPVKMFKESFNTKVEGLGVKGMDAEIAVQKLKGVLAKPRPLSVKRRIVDTVLEKLFEDILKGSKSNQSPKKIKEEITGKSELKTTSQTTPEKLPNGSKFHENLPTNEKSVANKEDFRDDDKDELSNDTFELPPEFIADRNSDDSMQLFETPKKLTTVDIQKDSSLEISENDKVINIDVVQMEENDNKEFIKGLTLTYPAKSDKCALKFNPTDKEALQEDKVDIDMESFKNHYLNEIDKDFKCSYRHSHKHCDKVATPPKLRTAIDFALDAFQKEKRKKLKRKLKNQDAEPKNKKDKIVVESEAKESGYIKLVYSDETETSGKTIDLTVESPKEKKKTLKKKKIRKQRDDIQVKIRFRKEKLKLKITQSKKKERKRLKIKNKCQLLKRKLLSQYVLNVSGDASPTKMISKPDHEITPMKRKYVKFESSPDNLVQTSIQSFFKKLPSTSTADKQ